MAEYLNKNLKHLRIKKGMSQQGLADKVGIDRSTISRIENNEIDTTVDNAIKIAEGLNVELGDLLGRDLTKENSETKENKQTINFGDIEVTLSKNGKITDKDMLELKQFLINEKILIDDNKNGK